MARPRSWLRGLYCAFVEKDPIERFRLLRRLARWLVPAYRLKWPHMAWWTDQAFSAYLMRFDEAAGLNTDRRWMMYQLLRMCASLPGDTAECGAYVGAGSYLIGTVNQHCQPTRRHLVFDSFSGLSEPGAADGTYWRSGDLRSSKETLVDNLGSLATTTDIYEGWIPEVFAEAPERRYAFVHVDVDLYQPTLDSLRYFYDRLVEGGVLLCDDYGLTTCPGATEAIDGFLASKPEKCLALCSGGGFMLKGLPIPGELAELLASVPPAE